MERGERTKRPSRQKMRTCVLPDYGGTAPHRGHMVFPTRCGGPRAYACVCVFKLQPAHMILYIQNVVQCTHGVYMHTITYQQWRAIHPKRVRPKWRHWPPRQTCTDPPWHVILSLVWHQLVFSVWILQLATATAAAAFVDSDDQPEKV
jgi:hypothetical protein